MAHAMARRDGMPRLVLIFLHSASADGSNVRHLLLASIRFRFTRRVSMIAYSAVSSDLEIASKQKQVPVPSKIFGSLKTVRRGIRRHTERGVSRGLAQS